MASECSWFMAGHVILAHMYDRINVKDIRGCNEFFLECLNSSAVPVYLLVDMTGLNEVAVGVSELRTELTFMKHGHLKEIAIFGCNDRVQLTVRFLSGLMGQLMHVSVRIFDTEQQALDFLQRSDIVFASLADVNQPGKN